ncbi:MAG TPA: FGGY family carbohydrate kinase [Micromonosporaceae bacterium]
MGSKPGAEGDGRILALDLGTSSVRGMVLERSGAPVPGALARRRSRLTMGRDGAGTLDADTYLAQLTDCLDELCAAGHLHGVDLVVTAAQWHSLVPLDAAGAPLGPTLTWLDTRATPPPDAPGPIDPEAFHQRTGAWWHRLYWTVRLPWVSRHSGTTPSAYRDLAGYLYGVLLEDAPMSVSLASGTGMLDLVGGRWDAEAGELAGVAAARLPTIADPSWRGRLRSEYARRWPDLRAADWTPPTGDGAAASVAADPDLHRAAVTVGTSTAVRFVQRVPIGARQPPLPATLWRYRVDHERIVTGAAYSGGGNLYAWCRRELRLPDDPDLAAALATVTPGVGGVQADPRFGGDRPPGSAPAGSGRLSGISFGTTAVELFGALMYGVCRQVADGLGDIESVLARRLQVVLGGGALGRSRWWRQAFVQALAPREVFHIVHPETAALGAAVLAVGLTALPVPCERVASPGVRPRESAD